MQNNKDFKESIVNLLLSFQKAMQQIGKINIASTMSGTSTDAVDVGFFDITAEGIKLKHAHTVNYLAADKHLIKNAEEGFRKAYAEYPTSDREILKQYARKYVDIDTATQLSEHYHIRAIKELLAKIPQEEHLKLIISYHGQTSFHKPVAKTNPKIPGITIQIGDPQVLANALGYPIIGDHRVRDVENGGQGAPFAPLYHFMLYKLGLLGVAKDESCATVNCGGIANIALLTPDNYRGFDTGPGAGLIQLYLSKYHNEQQDTDGQHAKQGKVDVAVLKALFDKGVIQDGINYFDKSPPKSLDFHDLTVIPELANLSKQDACATLAAFTAESIIRGAGKELPKTWILVGGGWNNLAIVAELKNRLMERIPNLKLLRETDLGLGYIECGIFAMSALFRLLGWAYTYPETTGVCKPVLAGNIYYSEQIAVPVWLRILLAKSTQMSMLS